MKRVLSLIISLVLALSVFSVMTASAAEEPICGDADGDGTITIMDATTIQRHLVDILQLSEERLKAADISGDGIDITDATQIQRWLAAYQVSYPIGELIEHEEESNDTLVVVFSRTGHTKPLAEYAATYLEADLFEIEAAVPYTDEDIAYYTN